MTITEAARQVRWLATDPSTALVASLNGWEHPISRTEIVLADLYDLAQRALIEGTIEPHSIRPTTPRPVREIDHDAVAEALRLTGHAI